jgi:hypothetical protein
MTENPEIQRAYQILDDVLNDVTARRTMPAGMRGRLYAVVDVLRREGAPAERVAVAQRICVTLYSLEWARLRRQQEQEDSLWRDLQGLSAEWHQTLQAHAIAG